MKYSCKASILFLSLLTLIGIAASADTASAAKGDVTTVVHTTAADRKKTAEDMAEIAAFGEAKACIFGKQAKQKVVQCTKAIQAIRTSDEATLKNLLPGVLASRGLGYAGGAKPDLRKAIKDYDSAIKLAPKTGIYYYYRGLAYVHENKAAPALRDFKDFVSNNKSAGSAVGYYYIGLIYNFEKDYTMAAAAYRQAIRINPGLKKALAKNLAYDKAQMAKGKKDERK